MLGLLTKLDTVEGHGFKAVREARKELVAQIERVRELEKEVIQTLRGGEEEEKVEEKVEETMGEKQVEKAVVEDVYMGDQPSHLRKCRRGTQFGRRAHGVLLTATLARAQSQPPTASDNRSAH